MSQDDEKCSQCGKLCGYDNNKGYWEGHNLAICHQCKENLMSRFGAFFGVEVSSDSYGLDIEWGDVHRILSNIRRDEAYLVSYIVTDKELYDRTKTLATSIVEG